MGSPALRGPRREGGGTVSTREAGQRSLRRELIVPRQHFRSKSILARAAERKLALGSRARTTITTRPRVGLNLCDFERAVSGLRARSIGRGRDGQAAARDFGGSGS